MSVVKADILLTERLNMSLNLQTSLDERLWNAIESTYQNRNYSGAILDAIHYLGQLIREKSGLESDGVSLAGAAFGGQNPILKITKLQTESDWNIQKGIEQILRGFYQAIRNPRSHQKTTDSVEDADSLIMMANYLVKLIDQSKSPYEKASFLRRVFDPLFPPDREYADLLVQEIPTGQRLDLLIQVFRDRETGDAKNLPFFISALSEIVGEDELQQFCDVVSNEMKTVEDDSAIRTAIQVVPQKLWCRYSELARRRIEFRLIKAIKDGRYNPVTDKFISGALGTWAVGLIPYFTLKADLIWAVTARITSSDRMAQAYALKCFFDDLPRLQSTPSANLRQTVLDAFKSGDELFYHSLWWVELDKTPAPWRDAFLAPYQAFVRGDGSQPITDDDVPF